MVLHGVMCVLVMYTSKMFLTELMSFILAVLFTAHPVHTEAVTGVVGRADLLCGIFMLIALKSYERGSGYRRKTEWTPIFLTVTLVVIAILCKEQGITVLGICCAYEVLWLQEITLREGLNLARLLIIKPTKLPAWFVWSLKRMCFLLFTAIGLMALRLMVMRDGMPHFIREDNPPANAPTPVRQMTQWYLLPVNAWILLYPYPLICDYSTGTIPLLEPLSDPRNLSTMSFVATLGLLTFYAFTDDTRTSRQVCMALAFVVFPFLPASNLFFPVGFVVAERILYIPSLGFSMLVVIGLHKLLKRGRFRKLIYAILIITVVFHGAKTARRNIDWKSSRSLFLSGLQITRGNVRLWNNAGATFDRGIEKSMLFHNQSILVRPDHVGSWISLGKAYQALGQDKKAMEIFGKAELLIRSGPPRRFSVKECSIYICMATILRKDPARHQDAIALLKKAIAMWNEYEEAFIQLGILLVEMGNLAEAEQVFKDLLKFAPRSNDGLYNMGVVYFKKNQMEAAKEWFQRCLLFHPVSSRNQDALRAIAEREARSDKDMELGRLLSSIQSDKGNYELMAKIGMIYKEKGDLENAEKYLKEALKINNRYGAALFAIGKVYRKMEDYDRALSHLEKYVKEAKDNIDVWILLGEIYVNFRNDYDAGWKAFQEAHRVDPDNIKVAHDLCVIMWKRKEFKEARNCLEELAVKSDEGFIAEKLANMNHMIQKMEDDNTSR